MNDKVILHLTLHRRWFDEIASGRKKTEYRKNTEYWRKRLLVLPDAPDDTFRQFDEVHFRNGYAKDAPFMRVQFHSVDMVQHPEYGECFAIELGNVLEIRNWKGESKQ